MPEIGQIEEKKAPPENVKGVKFDIKPIMEIQVPQFDEIKEKIKQIKLTPGETTPDETPGELPDETPGYLP